MANQEWLNGNNAAELDDYNGAGRRVTFAPYLTTQFIDGYNAFWEKFELELMEAANSSIDEYENRARFR